MTTGALIFAFDNEQTNYVAMAEWCAANIHRHLDIPVAVVTNTPDKIRATSAVDRIIQAPAASGGTRYFEDYQSIVTWHNAGRVDAYLLSPWDRTLVLDADYVVASETLKTLLQYDSDFMCHRTAMNLATASALSGLNVFGRHDLPMYWATVMMFRRSNTAQYIFDCMHMIRNNWQHYRDLYGIDKKTYRNDFALTIALGIVSGHTGKVDEIPWPLLTVMPDTELFQVEPDHYKITYTDSEHRLRAMSWNGTDFHAMGKRHLGDIVASNR
jgi:hypothetical protein